MMHQDLSGKALWGSQSFDLCKVTAVAVHAFFSEETSMHWKCQVTEAARSPSVYSKQNKRQKSQHRTWYITCVSLILKSYRCLYLFFKQYSGISINIRITLCVSHKPVPTWRVSIMNQPVPPPSLATASADFLPHGVIQLHPPSSSVQPFCLWCLSLSPSGLQIYVKTWLAKGWGEQWEEINK